MRENVKHQTRENDNLSREIAAFRATLMESDQMELNDEGIWRVSKKLLKILEPTLTLCISLSKEEECSDFSFSASKSEILNLSSDLKVISEFINKDQLYPTNKTTNKAKYDSLTKNMSGQDVSEIENLSSTLELDKVITLELFLISKQQGYCFPGFSKHSISAILFLDARISLMRIVQLLLLYANSKRELNYENLRGIFPSFREILTPIDDFLDTFINFTLLHSLYKYACDFNEKVGRIFRNKIFTLLPNIIHSVKSASENTSVPIRDKWQAKIDEYLWNEINIICQCLDLISQSSAITFNSEKLQEHTDLLSQSLKSMDQYLSLSSAFNQTHSFAPLVFHSKKSINFLQNLQSWYSFMPYLLIDELNYKPLDFILLHVITSLITITKTFVFNAFSDGRKSSDIVDSLKKVFSAKATSELNESKFFAAMRLFAISILRELCPNDFYQFQRDILDCIQNGAFGFILLRILSVQDFIQNNDELLCIFHNLLFMITSFPPLLERIMSMTNLPLNSPRSSLQVEDISKYNQTSQKNSPEIHYLFLMIGQFYSSTGHYTDELTPYRNEYWREISPTHATAGREVATEGTIDNYTFTRWMLSTVSSSPDLLALILYALSGISNDSQTASQCFCALQRSSLQKSVLDDYSFYPSSSDSSSSNRHMQTHQNNPLISWDHFFDSLRQYLLSLRQEAGDNSQSYTQFQISPEEIPALYQVLHLTGTVAKHCEHARLSIADNRSWKVLQVLVGLTSCSSLPISLKTEIFRTLSLFSHSPQLSMRILEYLRDFQIFQSFPFTSLTGSGNSRYSSWLPISGDQGRSSDANQNLYPLTTAFLGLIFQIVTYLNNPWELKSNSSGISSFNICIELVYATTTPQFISGIYQNSCERWQMIQLSLSILCKILSDYQLLSEHIKAAYSFDSTLNQQSAFVRSVGFSQGDPSNEPFLVHFKLLKSLSQDTPVLRTVLSTLCHSVRLLEVTPSFDPLFQQLSKCLNVSLILLKRVVDCECKIQFVLRQITPSIAVNSFVSNIMVSSPLDGLSHVSAYYLCRIPALHHLDFKIVNNSLLLLYRLLENGPIHQSLISILSQDRLSFFEILNGFADLYDNSATYLSHQALDCNELAEKYHTNTLIMLLLANCKSPASSCSISLTELLLFGNNSISYASSESVSTIEIHPPGIYGFPRTCFHSILQCIEQIDFTKVSPASNFEEQSLRLFVSFCSNPRFGISIYQYLLKYHTGEEYVISKLLSRLSTSMNDVVDIFTSNELNYSTVNIKLSMASTFFLTAFDMRLSSIRLNYSHLQTILRFLYSAGISSGQLPLSDSRVLELGSDYVSHENDISLGFVDLYRLLQVVDMSRLNIPKINSPLHILEASTLQNIIKQCESVTPEFSQLISFQPSKLIDISLLKCILEDNIQSNIHNFATHQLELLKLDFTAVIQWAVDYNFVQVFHYSNLCLMESINQLIEMSLACIPHFNAVKLKHPHASPYNFYPILLRIASQLFQKLQNSSNLMSCVVSNTLSCILGIFSFFSKEIHFLPLERLTLEPFTCDNINESISFVFCLLESKYFRSSYSYRSQSFLIAIFSQLLTIIHHISSLSTSLHGMQISEYSSVDSWKSVLNNLVINKFRSVSDEILTECIQGKNIKQVLTLALLSRILSEDHSSLLWYQRVSNSSYLNQLMKLVENHTKQLITSVIRGYDENNFSHSQSLYIHEHLMMVLSLLSTKDTGVHALINVGYIKQMAFYKHLNSSTMPMLLSTNVYPEQRVDEFNTDTNYGNVPKELFISPDECHSRILIPILNSFTTILQTQQNKNVDLFSQITTFLNQHHNSLLAILTKSLPSSLMLNDSIRFQMFQSFQSNSGNVNGVSDKCFVSYWRIKLLDSTLKFLSTCYDYLLNWWNPKVLNETTISDHTSLSKFNPPSLGQFGNQIYSFFPQLFIVFSSSVQTSKIIQSTYEYIIKNHITEDGEKLTGMTSKSSQIVSTSQDSIKFFTSFDFDFMGNSSDLVLSDVISLVCRIRLSLVDYFFYDSQNYTTSNNNPIIDPYLSSDPLSDKFINHPTSGIHFRPSLSNSSEATMSLEDKADKSHLSVNHLMNMLYLCLSWIKACKKIISELSSIEISSITDTPAINSVYQQACHFLPSDILQTYSADSNRKSTLSKHVISILIKKYSDIQLKSVETTEKLLHMLLLHVSFYKCFNDSMLSPLRSVTKPSKKMNLASTPSSSHGMGSNPIDCDFSTFKKELSAHFDQKLCDSIIDLTKSFSSRPSNFVLLTMKKLKKLIIS